MKKENTLIQFIAGVALLALGIFMLFQKVHVSTGFGGIRVGGVHVSGGFIFAPFIIGIVWMFINSKSIAAKILTGVGLVIIIASIIMNTHMYMYSTSLYEFILILVFIAAGLGLLIKTLFSNPKQK